MLKKLKIKKFKSSLFAVTLVSCPVYAMEGLTVGRYLEMKHATNKVSKEMVETYVSGLGQGILFSSIYSEQALKGRPLICPPRDLRITGKTAIDVLDEAIKKSTIATSEYPVGVVLVDAFAKKFPCK